MNKANPDLLMQNKVFLLVPAFTAVVLSLPLLGMQLNLGVNWTLSDFVTIAALLLGAGFTFIIIARTLPRKYRLPLGIAFILGVLYIWRNSPSGFLLISAAKPLFLQPYS